MLFNANENAQKQAAFDISSLIYLDKLEGVQARRLIEGAAKVATLDRYQIAAVPEFVRLVGRLGRALTQSPPRRATPWTCSAGKSAPLHRPSDLRPPRAALPNSALGADLAHSSKTT